MTDASVTQQDGALRLLSQSEEISYGATNSTANLEEPAPPLEAKNASYLAYVIPMAIGVFLAAMDTTIVISSYASIGSELNQLQNTSWIATAYMLTQTSFQPLSGKLSDIFGRKTCLLTCYAIFTVGSLLSSSSTSMTQLLIARAIAGIGGGGMTTLATIIMSDVVPLRVRGTWQGVLNIVFSTGSAVGAPLGGFLTDNIGWRWAFLIQVPICVVAIASVALTLHLPATSKSALSANIKRIDIGGAITLVLTVFFLLFGLDRGGNISWSDHFTIGSLIAFGISAILFMFFEVSVATEPFAPKRIITNFSLLACYLTNFFAIAGSLAQTFYISLFYQVVQEKTASEASLWLIITVVGTMVGSLSGGLIIQYTGKYYAITVTSCFLLLVGTCMVLFSSGVIAISTLGIAFGLAFTNIGKSSGITTTLIAMIAHAGEADQAVATAVSYLFRSLGGVVGLSVGSTLVQGTLRYLLRLRLSGDDAQEIVRRVRENLNYLNQLDPHTKAVVIRSYQDALQVTFFFTVVMAACSVFCSVFIREKELTHARS